MTRQPWSGDQWPLALACLSVVAWFLVLLWLKPQPLADERLHWPVILGLSHGQWPAPDAVPMLPTFHLVAAGAVRVGGQSLLIVRALSTVCTLVALVLLHGAVRVRHGRAAGPLVLLFAWNPLYFPYSVLAYTEPAALLALAAALRLHVSRRTVWAAGALLVACLVRQSNIVWVAFFAAWMVADRLDAGGGGGARRSSRGLWRAAWTDLWPYAAAVALCGGFLLARSSWALAPSDANRARVNIAQFYVFGFVVAVVWAPVWVQVARDLWPRRLAPALLRPWLCALALAVVGLLDLAFDNPHPWNWNPNFLHDRFVTLLYVSTPARYIVAIVIVLLLPLLTEHVWRRSDRYAVLTAWIFAILFLLPHWLVDHRYYIFPILFIHLGTRYTTGQMQLLCLWNGLLTLLAAGYVLVYGGTYSGL